ncbi:hypothetical protein J6590_004033 [Homalodisca vitripennis]|nr:hypothetical protein J6590_004033 [Homalodisca vitripennis]
MFRENNKVSSTYKVLVGHGPTLLYTASRDSPALSPHPTPHSSGHNDCSHALIGPRLDSDEEDVVNYYLYRRWRRTQREHWVHPYLRNNVNSRLFVAARELSQSDRKFKSFYRMTKDSFLELTRLVGPSLEKMDTHMRECIPAQERLMITLR